MKRKLKWFALFLVVLVLGFGAALFLWPRDRITVESYKLIPIGMTAQEVETILGGNGVTYDRFFAQWQQDKMVPGSALIEPEGEFVEKYTSHWIGQRGIVAIRFDQGHVTAKAFQGMRPTTFFERLRDWLGW